VEQRAIRRLGRKYVARLYCREGAFDFSVVVLAGEENEEDDEEKKAAKRRGGEREGEGVSRGNTASTCRKNLRLRTKAKAGLIFSFTL